MKFSLSSRTLLLGLTLAASLSAAAPAISHPDPAKKRVAILIFDGVQDIDYVGPLEVFSNAGFDVFTVGETKTPVTTASGDAVKLTPKYTFADAPQADLVVIPGGNSEAPKGSATVAWIKREAANAQHTMSVCTGAFTLANTGLLDGLKATTTAIHIQRMRRAYPAITVVSDERVVDNGRIITTAGLSAGIDGALHMVEVMKGEGAGRSAALSIEYDWRPNSGYVRGAMADRLIPRALRTADIGQFVDFELQGDKTRWRTTWWYTSKLAPAELTTRVKGAFDKAYALDGNWAPGSVRLTSSGPRAIRVSLKDRNGHAWKGLISVKPVNDEVDQTEIRYALNRVG